MAALFLLVNRALAGSALTPAYNAYFAYAHQNGYRFAPFGREDVAGFTYTNIRIASAVTTMANLALNFLRLNFDLFAWPCGFALAVLARGPRTGWLAAMVFGQMATHLVVTDGGIDTFGPTHFLELVLPIALLSASGLRALWQRPGGARALSPAILAALLAVEVLGVLPPRLDFLRRVGKDVGTVMDEALRAPPGSVVFTGRSFAPSCQALPGRHFVFFRPWNTLDFDDDIVWANHVSLDRDRELVAALHRRGFLLGVNRHCEPMLLPLRGVRDGDVPDSWPEQPWDFATPRRRAPGSVPGRPVPAT
ncbi:MAG: hypothetical protein WCJ30_13545 [Deltaproteobacteria bacterium]